MLGRVTPTRLQAMRGSFTTVPGNLRCGEASASEIRERSINVSLQMLESRDGKYSRMTGQAEYKPIRLCEQPTNHECHNR